MPALLLMVLSALGGVLLSTVFRFLTAIGLGFVVFNYGVPQIYSFITGYFNQLPSEVLNVVGILRLDIFMTMIISAVLVRAVYKISSAPLVSLGS